MYNAMCRSYLIKDEIQPIKICLSYWGWISLNCEIFLQTGGFRYTLVSNREQVFQTNYLDEAIDKYNKLIEEM